MIRLKVTVSLLLVLQLFLGAIAPASTRPFLLSDHERGDHSASTGERALDDDQMKKGLRFRLSEGREQPGRQPSTAPAKTTSLSESELQQVLKRLPAIKTEEADEQDFALRDRSLPPPRTGKIVDVTFPPPERPAVPTSGSAGPLEVLRYMPEGDVPLAPQLSVTFSQPMVAVTSRVELEAQGVPVKLTPEPRGKWRWVGTKTLLFVPDGRFPMATEYVVTVPTGTKSANGGTLAATRTWSFKTPAPQVKTTYPEGEARARDSIMFVEFDQRVDPAAVLRSVHVRAGKSELKIRLATDAEVERDETVSRLAKAAEKGRWVALRAVSGTNNDTRLALPGDSTIQVSIGPGTPSAEGPLVTAKAQEFSFRTYGPLRVTEHECGYDKRCSPFDSWSITFSNPLDLDAFQKSQVRVVPEIPGMKTELYGSTLRIEGVKKGRTIYRVTLDKNIRDQFGQTLEQDAVITFNVTSADPSLTSSGGEFVVLDPSGPPRYSVYSVNHNRLKVSLYSVGPEHWGQYIDYLRREHGYNDEAAQKQRTLPGRLVSTQTVEVKGRPDEMAETRIDLAPALDGGFGQIIVVVEPVLSVKPKTARERIVAWAQATQLGLDAFVDHSELIGWATSLRDGQPLADVQMTIQPSGVTGTSGADGLARLTLKPETQQGLSLLVARRGQDVAILPERFEWWNRESGWHKREIMDALRWYVFDDRKMYRPGEEVHIKGWIRRIGGGTLGDVGPLNDAAASVAYTLYDSRGNEVGKGTMALNALGGFDTVLKLPATMNLGSARMQLEAQGGSGVGAERQYYHHFQVQEFRRPEFEVTAQASDGPHFVGGHADASVTAAYYAGGGLPNTEVAWRVTSRPGNFTPPNRGDFTFGKWVPWWIARGAQEETNTETFAGRTDEAGKHRLRIDFDGVNPPRASNVTAEASVTDVNRQAWTAQTSLLVHPADLYVGLRSRRTFVQQGEPLVVESIVTDLDGKLIAGRDIRMRAVLLDWVYEKGQWRQQEMNAQECGIKSAGEVVKCTFQPKEGGMYRVTATIMDDRERRNESELTLWVAGGKTPPKREVEQEKAEMIPDRREYQPGDTAEVLVQSPFYPAEGVLTLRRNGIVSSERFKMDGPSYTLRIPIKEEYLPNVNVQVDLVGAAARTDDAGQPVETLPKRPAFAKGDLNLSIPPMARKLNVQATPREPKLEPGAETVVNVSVQDAAGRAVAGSEIAVVVVDEAILALTGYRLDDPLSIFYAQRGADVSDFHLREKVMLGNPEDVAQMMRSGGGAGMPVVMGAANTGMSRMALKAPPNPSPAPKQKGRARDGLMAEESAPGEGESSAINLRENFNALAVFKASVPTDASGRAQVQVKLPDNLTRYRIMAVSVAGGKQFGSGESSITARLPLMVRPSAPRFLNFGDRFEMPVVVQNQTDAPVEVDVAVRATNAELTDGAGRRVTVPANDRVEVRFPTSAGRAGTARFQVGAVSGRWADAAEVQLPVWTPATTEAFATYGEIDEGAIQQPVKAPADVFKQFGGLEITTSSTQLQELTDAVLYLVAYPYECSEQLSSRVLAIAALRDVLTAFEAKGLPKPEEMQAAVSRDLKRLQGMQNDDGGFGFWKRGDESWPYVSVHVAHALQRAKEKNFDVPAEMLEKSKRYLRGIEKRIPAKYPVDVRRALVAYALYVRDRMGEREAGRARSLIREAGLDKLSLEAVGWLLPVLSGDAGSRMEVEAIRRHLNNRVSEEAATAHFTTSYTDGDYLLLHSSRRADGIILEALIKDQPASDLVPKIVRGLLAHRTKGRWENTQENVFILLALDRYFATYEKVTPNFVARAWLGDRFAGGHEFRGRSTESQRVQVPMRYLADNAATTAQNLVLSKEGAGRLYYRVGMQYAPSNLKLAAADYGFTVERVYEAVDDPQDVRRDADGTWRIKAGATVRVRLTLAAPARRYHVALVDPLPAGLEALNPALAVTGSLPEDQKEETTVARGWWWWRTWYEHQNLRDERAEAFTSLLWEGVHTYSYITRATTPGQFVVPPPKAEEMYHPETFGRGASDRVVVE
jgi:alpha-2-macroglobulin